MVVRHETAEVAQAVKQMLSDEGLRRRFCEGGKRAASRLGWDEPVNAMEKIYARLAGLAPVIGESERRP